MKDFRNSDWWQNIGHEHHWVFVMIYALFWPIWLVVIIVMKIRENYKAKKSNEIYKAKCR